MEHSVDCAALERLIAQQYKTQTAFAEAVGVTRQYVSLVLKGERTPSLPVIMEFAEKLGVPVGELLGKELALAA